MKLKDMVIVFDDGDWIESKDQSSEGVRLLQTGNIGEGYFVNKAERKKFISEETFEKLKCKEVYSGDILISRLPEPVGRACIVPELDSRLITAVDCTICRINEDIVNKEYLCYFFQSQSYYNQVKQKVAGTTRKRISRKNLEQIKVYLPLLDIQGKIVQKLNTVSELISYRKKQLEDFDLLVKSQFVEMFGDIQKNTKKWEMNTLNAIADIRSGGTPSRQNEEYFKGNIPWITTVALGKITVNEKDAVEFITEEAIKNSSTKLIPAYSLLFGVRVGVGKISVNTVPMCTNQDIVAIMNIDDNRYNQIFLKNVIDVYFEYFNNQKRGATIQGIKSEVLKNINIPVVDISLQNQFATFVQQVDKSKFSCIMK